MLKIVFTLLSIIPSFILLSQDTYNKSIVPGDNVNSNILNSKQVEGTPAYSEKDTTLCLTADFKIVRIRKKKDYVFICGESDGKLYKIVFST